MVSLEQSFQSSSGFGEQSVYSSQKSIVQFSHKLHSRSEPTEV